MQKLFTAEGLSLPEVPWDRYPRPQLKRREWLCLNGTWTLRLEHGAITPVRVPFCPESLLSGVTRAPEIGERMNYQRSFCLPETWRGRRILLHFGAVSREAVVRINGTEVIRHDQAYLSFTADITDCVRDGENRLEVSVMNDLSPKFPRGKQSPKRGGMWYTPCSGIWQTVWLEPVPETYIRRLKIRTGSDWAEISAEGVRDGTVTLEGKAFPLTDGRAVIPIPDGRCWTPEDPVLYRFRIRAGEDEAESYFALRSLSIQTVRGIPRLCLNGKPLFFNALLDQGYWSDGLYTPASPEGFAEDILAMKQRGFNTLRKHGKIEPELFYYDCDRLGMIVFQDMVSSGEYRFLRDTALPTAHFSRRGDRRLTPDPETRKFSTRAGGSSAPTNATGNSRRWTPTALSTAPPAGSIRRRAMWTACTSILRSCTWESRQGRSCCRNSAAMPGRFPGTASTRKRPTATGSTKSRKTFSVHFGNCTREKSCRWPGKGSAERSIPSCRMWRTRPTGLSALTGPFRSFRPGRCGISQMPCSRQCNKKPFCRRVNHENAVQERNHL